MKKFITTCVQAKGADITAYLDTQREITARTFIKHIGLDAFHSLEQRLGYRNDDGSLVIPSLSLQTDQCVRFGKGIYRGRPAVDCTWSCIEHIFA